jgi:hypothetical protein
MAEYRARHPSSNVQPQPAPVAAKKKFGLSQLAQRYGVADMIDFSNYNSHNTDQTIDEEFLAYTTAHFSLKDMGNTDILAFWEVRIFIHFSRILT